MKILITMSSVISLYLKKLAVITSLIFLFVILKATTVQIQNLWFNSFQVIEIQIPGNLSSSSHKAIIIQILGISHAAYANYPTNELKMI